MSQNGSIRVPAGDACACQDDNDPRRWRNAPLAQRLFIIHNLMMKVGDRLVRDLGLTSSRWLLLGAIEQFEKPPSLSELSSSALLSVQNVSRMVASMEADGILERFSPLGSGRTTYVRLTEKGKAVQEQTERAAEVFADTFLKGFSAQEIEAMETQLERLITNLESLTASQGMASMNGSVQGTTP